MLPLRIGTFFLNDLYIKDITFNKNLSRYPDTNKKITIVKANLCIYTQIERGEMIDGKDNLSYWQIHTSNRRFKCFFQFIKFFG